MKYENNLVVSKLIVLALKTIHNYLHVTKIKVLIYLFILAIVFLLIQQNQGAHERFYHYENLSNRVERAERS